MVLEVKEVSGLQVAVAHVVVRGDRSSVYGGLYRRGLGAVTHGYGAGVLGEFTAYLGRNQVANAETNV